MVSLSGKYKNGKITLNEDYQDDLPENVLVTFLDTPSKSDKLTLDQFSFRKSQTLLKDLKGNLSDEIIEDRRI